ncbi:MAG: hypothetical protein NUV59_02805 [Patescibacteria group bacterium]|nr:hypothetical protein [Patescibacteria group bacterium]
MSKQSIIRYVLLPTIVVILGGLAGWYMFLRGQTQATVNTDTGRGFNVGLPIGDITGSGYSNLAGGGSQDPKRIAGPLPRLWQASQAPVAGFSFTETGTSTKLRFVDRGNGYLFAADFEAQALERVTNTLMPKTYEAYISDDKVVARTVDGSGVIRTFAGAVASTSPSEADGVLALEGADMEGGISAMDMSPETGELFYLLRSATGTVGYRAQWGSGKRTSVFSSAVSDWRPWLLSDDRIILLLKPADGALGYAYILRSNGTLASLVESAPGLTILPRSGSSALIWGTSGGAGLALYARVNSDATATTLPIRTVADKCAWAPSSGEASEGGDSQALVAYCGVPQAAQSGNFLGDWYGGARHTADSLWRVDVSAGTAELVYAPSQGITLDIKDPAVDPSGGYIAFKNARDESLWVLRIDQ